MLDMLLKLIQAILVVFVGTFILCLGILILSFIIAPVILLILAIIGFTKIAVIATVIYAVIGLLILLFRKTGENNGQKTIRT